jgi:hypothetical protein
MFRLPRCTSLRHTSLTQFKTSNLQTLSLCFKGSRVVCLGPLQMKRSLMSSTGLSQNKIQRGRRWINNLECSGPQLKNSSLKSTLYSRGWKRSDNRELLLNQLDKDLPLAHPISFNSSKRSPSPRTRCISSLDQDHLVAYNKCRANHLK